MTGGPARRDRLAEIARFGAVGGVATLVHGGLYLALVNGAATPAQAANLAGFAAAFAVSLVGHSRLTFRDAAGRRGLAASSWRFLLIAAGGYGCNAAFVHLVTGVLGLDARYALVFIVGVTPILVFCLSKFWVFRARAR